MSFTFFKNVFSLCPLKDLLRKGIKIVTNPYKLLEQKYTQKLRLDLKQNKSTNITQQKQTHRYREQPCGCQKGRRAGGWVKQVKGIQIYNKSKGLNVQQESTANIIVTLYAV